MMMKHIMISVVLYRLIIPVQPVSPNSNTSLNRLTATFHLIFKNTLDETKNFEADVTYSVDFDANLSLNQVEQQKGDEISKNLTEAIFNKIFSNW
jgi:hypothetical protein